MGWLLLVFSIAMRPEARSAISFTSDLTALGPNLEIADTDGFGANGTTPNTVSFSGSGATFNSSGNDSRNYIRTVDTDYDTGSFIVDVTWNGVARAFYGYGGGNYGTFGTPDWDVADSLWIEINGTSTPDIQGVSPAGRFSSAITAFSGSIVAGAPVRLRMVLDMSANTLQFLADNGYAGGAFVADVQTAALNLATVTNAPPNFLTEVSDANRFYFGGEGSTFSNFSVSAVPEPGSALLLVAGICGLAVARGRKH